MLYSAHGQPIHCGNCLWVNSFLQARESRIHLAESQWVIPTCFANSIQKEVTSDSRKWSTVIIAAITLL